MDRQREFDERNSLGFPLLSDPDRTIARALGAKRFGPVPNRRVTFVIDTDGTLLGEIRSETDMMTHADESLEILRNRAA